jgi:hypothetical protein
MSDNFLEVPMSGDIDNCTAEEYEKRKKRRHVKGKE